MAYNEGLCMSAIKRYRKCAEKIRRFIYAWKAEVHTNFEPVDAPIVAANFLWIKRRWHEYDFKAAYVYAFTESLYEDLVTGALLARPCDSCAQAPPVGVLMYEGERIDYWKYWDWRESADSNEYIVLMGPWPRNTPEIPHYVFPGTSYERDCVATDREGANELWKKCFKRDIECHMIKLKDMVKYAPLVAIGRAMKHGNWLTVKAMQNAVAEALYWFYETQAPRDTPAAIIVDSIVVPEHVHLDFSEIPIPVKHIYNDWGERYSLSGLIHRKERDKWRAWILGQDVVYYDSIDYYYENILDRLLKRGRSEEYPHDTIYAIIDYFKPVVYSEMKPLENVFKGARWWMVI